MSRDIYTRADRLNGHPETPRQKTERYKAAVNITGTPRTEQPTRQPDPWLPLYVSVGLTFLLVITVTAAVLIGARS